MAFSYGAGTKNFSENSKWIRNYPDMRKFALPAPEGVRPVKAEELRLDRIRAMSVPGFRDVFGNRETVFAESEKLLAMPSTVETELDYLNRWVPGKPHHNGYAFTFSHFGRTAHLYFATGHPLLGRYLHDYVLHAATLPEWFYVGDKVKEESWQKNKIASLSATGVTRAFIKTLCFAGELFTATERAFIEEAVRKNCYELSLRWMQQRGMRNSNWVTVIGNALLMTGRYFGDEEAVKLTMDCLRNYVQIAVEEDGSYGESFHYFCYGFGSLVPSWEMMSDAERERTFAGARLSRSSRWCASHILFRPAYPDQTFFHNLSFGDSNVNEPFPRELAHLLEQQYGDKLSRYLACNEVPPAALLAEIPLAQAFDTGEVFLRSSWQPDATVVAALAHHEVQSHWHRRPESGNFLVGVDGFPLVVPHGNTNEYKRPLYKLARQTSSANTLLLDGQNQKHHLQQNCKTILARENSLAAVSVQALEEAYVPKFQSIRRHIFLLKPSRTVVVFDTLRGGEAPVSIVANIHFNDIRHDASLVQDGLRFHYERPNHISANLFVGACDEEATASSAKSFVVSELYNNRDEESQLREKEKGNAFRVTYGLLKPATQARLYAVLQTSQGSRVPVWNQDSLLVDGISIRISPTQITLQRGDVVENLPLAQ
ncbi:MAG: heparinase II/III family protein [Victivallales bacterium]|nr:heparinase II/III family protein [Victivallales bacterium]